MQARNIEWPKGAKIAVNIIVPWEFWPESLGTLESIQAGPHRAPPANATFSKSMSIITEREYGDRVGVWRLLDLFKRQGVKATFLMNGAKVEQNPEVCKQIKADGHEFASEGYVHEYSFMMTKEHEQESIRKSIGAFEKVVGVRPAGYLSPGHDYTSNTLELIIEAGYLWWADPLNDDLPYKLALRGKPIVVIPYVIPGLNDYSVYTRGVAPQTLLQNRTDQFDYLYREGKRGNPKFFAINAHPFLSGRPYMAKLLEDFITYMKRRSGVWFASRAEVAKWWLKRGYD